MEGRKVILPVQPVGFLTAQDSWRRRGPTRTASRWERRGVRDSGGAEGTGSGAKAEGDCAVLFTAHHDFCDQ